MPMLIPTAASGHQLPWALARVETTTNVYFARIYIAEKGRLSDVLTDDRLFLYLRDVSTEEGVRLESFMAVNKSYIRSVRVLNSREEADYVTGRGCIPPGCTSVRQA
jgi:uncharacterized protein DUF6812